MAMPDVAAMQSWLADLLGRAGRLSESPEVVEQGAQLFENMLDCRNHLGLLSEDINPESNGLWGNFPQTYSLVGLINCAMKSSKTWEDVV